ncbi:MAG: NUDIX domain-containing protein [Acetobacteraceae bacterium]|nr:NUDIX domain-containing protein [Acetobacteraceae bacterium]
MPDRHAAFPVTPALRARADPRPAEVPPAHAEAVERCWAAAQARAGGRLFDGTVFSVTELAPDRLLARAVPYRLAVAAYAEPALAAALDIRPLAVCGVLRMADGILFGRRQAGATYEAGLWQMPPAGSVDAGALRDGLLDVEGMIRAELREEVGLAREEVTSCTPFCVVVHPGSRVHDLGFVMETPLPFAEVRSRAAAAASAEYPELAAVPEAGLPAFLEARAGQVVPTARLFLEALGLLRGGGAAA